jgi:hypothetical protein
MEWTIMNTVPSSPSSKSVKLKSVFKKANNGKTTWRSK